MTTDIRIGDSLEVLRTMPDESVHCVITSPPYWGLRDYGTADWEGGDVECEHMGPPKASSKSTLKNDGRPQEMVGQNDYERGAVTPYRTTCGKCGAIRIDKQMGLEATPELFIANMVEVFREVRRVLRSDGTCWVNLGDSYYNYRPGGTSQSKQTIAKHDGAVVEISAKRNNKIATLKEKDLCGIPWRVALALQADGWWLRSDIIWCLSGGTRVYAKTQKGEMPMTIKDMVRLDPSTVQLWNGEKWTQVLGWNESPRPDAPLEITLRSGERIGCTPGHKFPTNRGLQEARWLVVGDIIETTTLPDRTHRAALIPDYDIGWFVGMYLAEGSRGKGGRVIQIASHQKETDRLKMLQNIAKFYDGTCQAHDTSDNGMTINLYGSVLTGIIDQYISGKTAKDKHLSMKCWQRNNEFLNGILRGYLEGDGHHDIVNDRWRLGFTRNYNLEADLRTLCARLGVSLRLNPAHSGDFKTFRGEIRFTKSDHFNTKQNGEVVKIGRSRARKFWDIGVKDNPHLFALASGVLTHNSKPNPMPESVTDRPTKAHEYVFLLTKSARYFYDADAVREKANKPTRMAASFRDGGVYTGNRSNDNAADKTKDSH